MTDDLAAGTRAEVDRMLAAGMTHLTRSEYLAAVDAAGYEVDPDTCCSYTNNLNPWGKWRERSLGFRDKATKVGFAHYQGRRDAGFRELQRIRFECFTVVNGRIWQ